MNKLAEELINSGGDPESRAGKRVCELVLEATKLNACISICNPTGERRPPREVTAHRLCRANGCPLCRP